MTLNASGLTIGVLGLGHVGLPTALCFAELGWPVIGADDAQSKAHLIAKGESTFYEPGLDLLLHKHLASGLFRVAPDVATAVQMADVLFICVGTPQKADGAADLAQIETVARTIAGNLNGFKLVVEKSTSPVQTAEQIKRAILRYSQDSRTKRHGVDAGPEALFEVAVNPEFLREGTAIQDFFAPDRIVVGVESLRARDLMTRLYQQLLDRLSAKAKNGNAETASRLLVTDLNTAEIIKHASNAFLSTKISFINMVADLCDATGADISEVQQGLQMDQRIGRHFLQAGVGFGGYCLPKDLRALIHIGESYGVDMGLLKGVEGINVARVGHLVDRLKQALWVLDGKTVAIWGLAFKPETDDVREAPSVKVVAHLLEQRCNLRLFDPQANAQFQTEYKPDAPRLVYSASAEEAAESADAIMLLTDWPAFRAVDFERLRGSMSYPLIVDGRNYLDSAKMRHLGFQYIGMGRRAPKELLAEGGVPS